MSSKPSNEDPDLPSYHDVITASEPDSSSRLRNEVQSEVHSELLSLALSFSSIRGAKRQQLQRDDERALNLLIPYIKAFLAEYIETALPMATLILIPADSVSPLAVPADDDLRSADDFGRVIAVAALEKGGDGNGDGTPVWSSAETAERLASYLRPRSAEPPPRPEQSSSPPVQTTSSKKSFWWRKSAAAPAATASPVPPADVKATVLPKVTMAVKAEEVVFRVECELGLYENQTVWGIVIKVRVNAGKQGY